MISIFTLKRFLVRTQCHLTQNSPGTSDRFLLQTELHRIQRLDLKWPRRDVFSRVLVNVFTPQWLDRVVFEPVPALARSCVGRLPTEETSSSVAPECNDTSCQSGWNLSLQGDDTRTISTQREHPWTMLLPRCLQKPPTNHLSAGMVYLNEPSLMQRITRTFRVILDSTCVVIFDQSKRLKPGYEGHHRDPRRTEKKNN